MQVISQNVLFKALVTSVCINELICRYIIGWNSKQNRRCKYKVMCHTSGSEHISGHEIFTRPPSVTSNKTTFVYVSHFLTLLPSFPLSLSISPSPPSLSKMFYNDTTPRPARMHLRLVPPSDGRGDLISFEHAAD